MKKLGLKKSVLGELIKESDVRGYKVLSVCVRVESRRFRR